MVQVANLRDSVPRSSKSNTQVQITERSSEPRTVDELVRARAEELPDHALVSYPHHGLDYVDYTAQQLDQYAYHVANQYSTYLQTRTRSSDKALVVGLLGLSSLDYLVTAIAMLKLGHTALHLSTRISHEAYVDLLEKTGAVLLLVDDAMHDVATKCQSALPALQVHNISIYEEYIQPVQQPFDTNMTPGLDLNAEQDTVAWIIHSSGSTGLPKPIYQTQRAAMNNYKGNMNMRGFITLPLFHAHGIASTFRAIYSSKQIHIYNAKIPLTKQYLMEVMRRFQFEIFYGVPYVLKLLAENQEGIQLLAKCKVVMFGGSACPDELGDKLVENGVNLVSHWGSTETGQLMTSFRPVGDKAWNYLRPSQAVKPFLRMEDRGEGLFEAVCLPGWPSKVATNQSDGSYAMKDLFTKHPQHDWWKYYGRLDDTIVLVNGEKAMPLPIEGAARQHPWVSEAVMFGKGRDRLGLAIVRASAAEEKTDEEVVQEVMSTIEKTQSGMPAYAQISSDMLLILDPDTDYPRTDKGTVIRMKFYKRFEKKTDAFYETINSQKGSLQLNQDDLRAFLRQALQQSSANMQITEDDQDFFNAGMDSLQATRLRAAIVKDVDVGDNQLGINVAFEYPTISKLASHLYALRTGQLPFHQTASVEDEMQRLIEKYSTLELMVSRPQQPQTCSTSQTKSQPQAQTIVLTGVTGSLGAHVATLLARNPSVSKIYCLIRASSSAQASLRLQQSLAGRGLTPLPPSSQSKLIALPATLTHPTLGVDEPTYTELVNSTTHIIHSAWSVNFNLSLSSFEDCLLGVHNLINLALLASNVPPPHSSSSNTSTVTTASLPKRQCTFNFCSSISTVMRTPSPTITETLPQLSSAQAMGYAQSKLVAEHICSRVTDTHNLQTRILRIGQIIGDTENGVWNRQEAIPTMMQAAVTVGAVPALDESVRWLPVDFVARACVDVALQGDGQRDVGEEESMAVQQQQRQQQKKGRECEIYNILNPQTLHWTRHLIPLLREEGLTFDEVPVQSWLERLRASNPDPGVNPPVKLLDFWMGKYGNTAGGGTATEEKKVQYAWVTDNAIAASPGLTTADKGFVLDVVTRSLRYFREECW